MNALDYTKKLIPYLTPEEIRFGLKGCQTEGITITGFNKEPWKAPISLIQQSMESSHKKRKRKTVVYKIFLAVLSSIQKADHNDERSEIISKICSHILRDSENNNYAIDYLFCYFVEINPSDNNIPKDVLSDSKIALANLQKEFNQLQKTYDKLSSKHAILQNKFDSCDDTLNNLRQLIKNIKKDKEELENLIVEKDKEIDELLSNLSKLQADYNRLNDRNLYLAAENKKIENLNMELLKNNMCTVQQCLFENHQVQTELSKTADCVVGQLTNDETHVFQYPHTKIMAIGCELFNLQCPSNIEIRFGSNDILTLEEYIEQYDEIWIMRSVIPFKHKMNFNRYAEESEKFHLFDSASELFNYIQDYIK